jgi:hypothetical protein
MQARHVLSNEGVKSLGYRILSETLYRRVILMERPLHEPIAEVMSALPVVIDRLKPTDIEEYVRFRLGTDPLLIRRRLSMGQCAFVARHDARIVHAGWTTTKQAWIDFLAREITLAPDEVYQYESFTAPGFRGNNLAAMRITAMLHHFQKAGYRRMIAVVVPESTAAFRPLEKTGYRPFGMLGYVRLGPWRRHFCRVSRHALPPGGDTHKLSYTH